MQHLDIVELLVDILVSFGDLIDWYGDVILHAIEVYLKMVKRLSTPKRSKHKRTRRKKIVRKKPRH